MTSRRLDDGLSVRNSRLYVEECDTLDLLREFGSPLFVFSEDQLRRNVRRFHQAFQAGWPAGPVVVMPAAKANWLAAIQRILADEGCGCDTDHGVQRRLPTALEPLSSACPRTKVTVREPKDLFHIPQSSRVRPRTLGFGVTKDRVASLRGVGLAANTLRP